MSKPVLNVALVGYSFMGRAHSNAYQQVNRYFADCPYQVVRKVLVGRTAGPLQEAAATWGWEETSTDLAEVLKRDDIDIVDIATPNNSHYELALQVLAAGKHVLCEKPLALTTAQAREMAAVAAKTKGADGKPVRTFVWHNYRRAPAATTAAEIIRDGKIGEIRQVRAVYLQDWLSDANVPSSWRMQAKVSGSGAHGDLNAHLIDMCRYLTGLEFVEVSALEQTFTKKRPNANGKGTVAVDVDDAFLFLAKLSNGATGSFEATRVAPGHKNYNRIEINGTKGSVAWNFERMNELEFFSFDEDARTQGFRTIMCMDGAVHPYAGNYWPNGHVIGYEHTFTNALADFLVAFKTGKPYRPDFADGVANQEVIEAAAISARTHAWVVVEHSQKFAKETAKVAVKKNAGL